MMNSLSQPTAHRRSRRIEHEYERQGAWAYLAAWVGAALAGGGLLIFFAGRVMEPAPAECPD